MTFDSKDQRESTDRPLTLTGRTVLDSRQIKAGKVTDVLFDDGDPGWAIVKTGRLHGEHFVPLQHSYVDADGRLIVSVNKSHIQHAPRTPRDHVMTTRTRLELRDYYGIAA